MDYLRVSLGGSDTDTDLETPSRGLNRNVRSSIIHGCLSLENTKHNFFSRVACKTRIEMTDLILASFIEQYCNYKSSKDKKKKKRRKNTVYRRH